MIHRHVDLACGPLLEQLELADGTRITCIPDLGPVQWPRDALLRGPMDAAMHEAIANAPAGTVAADGSTIRLCFNMYLVQSRQGTILIDAGIGNGKTRPDRPAWHRLQGPFPQVLAALDVAPGDIDLVVNTHLHADHVGWNTVQDDAGGWRPTFPNAEYLTSALDLASLQARAAASDDPQSLLHGAYADSIEPIIHGPGYRTVGPGDVVRAMTFIALPGHTSGMLGLIIGDATERVVFSADAIHHPIQLSSGVPASNFCADPDQSIITRTAFLERCVEDALVVAPYHFPQPAFGRIARTAGGHAYRPMQP